MTSELLSVEIDGEYWSDDFKMIIERINQSQSIEQLLKHFKEFTVKIKSDGLNEKNLKKLIKVYFNLKLKHPIKNSIQAFFNQIKSDINAQQIFNSELEKQIILSKNLSIDDRYNFVSCINEMSQNFHIAEVSIGLQAGILLDFLMSCVDDYIKQLKTELSPSNKNEISHRLHNCLQATIFCVKSHLSQDNRNENVKNQLKKIAETCSNLLNHKSDISLDTKNICAILIVTNNIKISSQQNHMTVIQNESENPMKKLCFMFGVITVQQNLDIEKLERFTKILGVIYSQNSIDNAIIYAVSRLFALITKKLLTLMKPTEFSPLLQSITKSTLTIAFLNLEHYVESVRYLARDSLKNLVELGMKIDSDEKIMINEIFTAISSVSSISTQAIVINAIHTSMPVSKLLQRMPNFQSSLLFSIAANKEHKMSCYEGLSSKSYKESSFDEWFNLFIEPLIESIKCNQQSEEEYGLLKNLLLKCVKKNKNAIKMILTNSHDFDIGFHLLCLSMAKMEGALEDIESNEEMWKGVIKFDEIQKYMVNIDADIRLAAFQLIVDTKKSTECFTLKEIECILYFFKMNINVQSPSTRQNILAMIKKIFIRLNSAIQFLIKRNESENLGNQLNMLRILHESCMDNLVEGANFSRRSLSLTILSNILNTIRDFFPSEITNLWKNEQCKRIIEIFSDSFETNKEIALEILKNLPEEIIKASPKPSLEQIGDLMTSIRPADSLTAAYLLQFSIKFGLNTSNEDKSSSNKSPEHFRLLIWSENLLLKALTIGERSIIVAAGSNPMYGILLCIRYIISKLDLCDLRTCSLWQSFFDRLISVCKRLSHVVGPIVNDSSPEGCVPKENLVDASNDCNSKKIIEHTTPQMVLLCAWRSIREVSLLLGDLSLRAQLSVDQMMEIGNHFIELLSNIKHRGAFEQAFFGFSQFSVALRQSDNVVLHNLPEKLLHNIITSVSGEHHENENDFMQIKNLCATRRSAGLPYIIQALLTSEIKISQVKNFHFVMRNLINFARHGVQMETRIHSLNILRALFRCKEFNDVIGEYISPALQCSLLGYGAHSWAEKNSSTLLFSALMIRIFGVQRNKDSDDINIKNKMSGRIFFLRYPELYEFFMAQLIEAIDHVKEQKMNSKLHPLMLLLNRLYTSISDNSESNLKLIDFITIVAMCSSCCEFQTRVLCAKFIANVVQPCHLLPRVNKNIKVLRENSDLIGNSKHARILEIFYLIKSSSIDSVNDFIDILNDILGLLENFKNELVCFGTLLDVIIEIFLKLQAHLPNERIQMDKMENCFNFNKSAYFGFALLQSKLTAIHLLKGEIDFALNINALMNSCELLEKLNCLILLLNNSDSDIAEEFEIDQKVCLIVRHLSNDLRQKLEVKIYSNNQHLISELRKIANSNDANLAARSLEVLSSINMKIDEEHFAELINGFEEKPEVIRKSILKYVNVCISSSKFIDNTNWKFLSKCIDSSFHIKSATIDILKQLTVNLHLIQSQETFFMVIKCIVILLVDDDFDIRKKTSEIVSELLRLKQVFMGPYAQEVFIRHLLEQSTIDRDKVIGAIIILMYEEEAAEEKNEDEKSNHITAAAFEFQVFEKNESSSYRESFAMRKLCLPILRNDDNVKRFSSVYCSIISSEKLEEFQKFFTRTFC